MRKQSKLQEKSTKSSSSTYAVVPVHVVAYALVAVVVRENRENNVEPCNDDARYNDRAYGFDGSKMNTNRYPRKDSNHDEQQLVVEDNHLLQL